MLPIPCGRGGVGPVKGFVFVEQGVRRSFDEIGVVTPTDTRGNVATADGDDVSGNIGGGGGGGGDDDIVGNKGVLCGTGLNRSRDEFVVRLKPV